jgi:ABC-type hemin transport system substrate-binding protein
MERWAIWPVVLAGALEADFAPAAQVAEVFMTPTLESSRASKQEKFFTIDDEIMMAIGISVKQDGIPGTSSIINHIFPIFSSL